MTTEITFQGKVAGNNGPGGLLRLHWTKKKALSERYQWQVKAQAAGVCHAGPVRLELIRYSSGNNMDYDNLVSTGKVLTDSIVKCAVLPDDNPAVIVERQYTQEKCPVKNQRTVVRIIDLNP